MFSQNWANRIADLFVVVNEMNFFGKEGCFWHQFWNEQAQAENLPRK